MTRYTFADYLTTQRFAKIELAENIRKIDDFDITKYSSQ